MNVQMFILMNTFKSNTCVEKFIKIIFITKIQKKKRICKKYQYEYMDNLVYLTIKIRMIAYNSVSLLIEKTIKI